MSRNSENNRKRRAKKKVRSQKRRAANKSRLISPAVSLAEIYDDGTLLTVSVIRPTSGKSYAEGEALPLFDRELLEVHNGVPIHQAEELAVKLQERINAGEFPSDARVTSMSQPTFHTA